MNTPDRLSAEEREFARLLGGPAVDDGPSPAIDAAIIAMAQSELKTRHNAASPPAADRRLGTRRRRRPLSLLAAAASMVLAVGIAWQLRPLAPERESAPDQETAAQRAMAPAAAEDAAAESLSADNIAAAKTVPPPVVPPAPPTRTPPTADPAPAGTAHKRAAAGNMAADIEPPLAALRTAPAPAPMIIAPPSPPAPPAAMAAPAMPAPLQMPTMTEDATQSFDRQEIRSQRSLLRQPASPAPQDALQEVVVTGSRALEADLESDAALPQRQWLQRIRERQRDGDLQGARASLRRFALDHPDAHIPRALRPLLQD